jgi:hypothetical protein
MPRGDRTGPDGEGPMTGRARGYCAGYPAPGYASGPLGGRGRGMGFGRGGGPRRGRGFGWRRYVPFPQTFVLDEPYSGYSKPTKEEEKVYLEKAMKEFEEDLKEIRDRLKELQKEDK